MEELYNALVEQGKYTKSFEDFKAQFSAPEKTKILYESLNSSGDYTKSFENFTSQFGFAEKKNQVDTPSDGQEEVTESITETETIPGSSDSLEEQGEVPVIPLVQDDNGDLTPFVEIPPVNQPDSVVVDTKEVEINPELLDQSKSNLELLNSVGYIEAKGQNKNILDELKKKGDERVDDIIMKKTYPVMENGEVVYKKEEEIAPELLDAMKIYDKSIDDSYKKNYDDVQVDFEDFQRDDIPDADKLQSLKINQEDYLKWDKVNTRQEGSVFKFFKTALTNEEGDEFEKEQRQYEKVQSYQATVLNGITNDLEKNKAQQKLTTDTQALKKLRKEEELLTGSFYETLGTINSAIDLFPKFKELTEDTDLKKRRRLFFAAKKGGMNEFEEGVRQKIRIGGGTAVNYATKFFAGIPGFFDQRLSAMGYDKKGLLAGLSDMLSDSAEHYDIDYGATNRSAFIDGKPVTYKGEEFFVDSNGKVYDKQTNLLMDGIIGQDAIKEIQERSKNVPNDELQFTGGSVLDGTTGTLLNLFALIKSGTKVNKSLGLDKRLGKKLAGKVGMGLASFTSGVVDNVEDIRSQLMATGMSEKEAMNIAVNAGQAISTLDGVFSGIAGSNEKLLTGFQGIKDQIKNLAINKGKDFTRKQFQQKSVDLLKENAKELFIEELPVYFSEKAINNLVNRNIGNDVLDDNITRAGITETVVMTIGATSALGSRKLLSGNRRSDLVRLAAKNVENLQETLDALVKEGSLTKKEAMSAYTEIYNMQTAENKTKGTIVVSENMQEASDLLTQRQNLINEKQGLEGPLKENIDKRIADVDSQLDALYKRDKQQARDIIKGEQEGTIDVTVTREEALESLKAENETNKRLGLPTILESDENILKEQNKLIKERQPLKLTDGPDFTKEAVASLKEEGIDDPTLNQVADRAEQITKQKEDAIPKPSTEEQVLPDAKGSQETGSTTEVGLQQVGEGDVEQVTTETQVKEGETQTDTTSDTTTQTDTEQLVEPTSTEEGMSVNKDSETKKESEGASKLRDSLRKSGTTVKRNTSEQTSKLGKQIENAKKALSKILPDVEIIMPSSEAEYKRLTGESANQNSGGTYIDGKIYINPNRASSRVVSHEVFHAVLLSKGMSNSQARAITERMLSVVKKSGSKELLEKLDKFSKRYPEAFQSEESIAELVGILASEYDTLPKPSQNIVKRWLDKLAKIFGIKPFTDVEVVDLLNTLASKVESGQELSAKDVKILDSKESKNKTEARKSSAKPTIEEIVTKGKELGISDADIREVAQQEGYANKDTNSEIEKYDTKKRESAQKAEKLFVKGGKIAKSLDFLRRWALSARGFLPKSMQIGKEVLTGAVASNAKEAENNLKDLQRYIKNQKKSVQDKLVEDLNAYMRGNADIDTLPSEMAPIAYAMRNHIDSLSSTLAESGAITDIKFDELSPKQKKELIKEFGTEEDARKNYKSQKENIIDNLGSYLNRSFEVFDSENYSPSDTVLSAAKAKLREQYAEAAKEKALEENNDVDAVLEKMVDNAIEKILNREDGIEFLNSSKLGSKNIGVLKEKIDIPAEIRALMGEYTDPALNYVRSVNKISALIASQEFLDKIKKSGEGVFLFNEPTGEYNVKISPDGSNTYNPLNGMYTSKAIRDAVLNIPGAKINDNLIMKGLNFYYKLVGIVKYSKTILSPATHAKNIIGNLFFMAYNGYVNPKVYFDAANVVIADIKGKDKKDYRKKMQEYIKLGFINQSSNLGEIRSLLQNEGGLEDLMAKRTEEDKTPLKRLRRFFKKSGKLAEDAYQAEDDVFKIISFEMEKKRYSKALFNKTFDKLSPEQQKEVTEKVTEIVKDILPNYSRIGGIGKFMKAVPVAGTFISFQIEAMRTAYNVANLALSELKNPNTAGIGLKRLTGIFSVMAVKAAILPMFGVAGQTLTEAVKSALGDEDEDEEEVEKEKDVITESSRDFLPPWAENANVIITKLDNGKFNYINFSASDPHAFIDQAIISAFRGETAAQGMGEAVNSLMKPFVTKDILFKSITSVETDYGKEIFNETDTPNEIAEKTLGILYKTFEPGGVTSSRKLFKAYEDKEKSLLNEVIGQATGFKVHTVDFEKQLIFKSLDLRKRVDLASKDYSKAYYERKNKDISEDDLEKRYEVANDKYKQVMKEGVRFYDSSLKLGSSRFKSYNSMYGYKKLSRYEMSYIINGKIPDLKNKRVAKYKLK